GIVTTLKEGYLWTPSIAKEAVSTINYELISAGYDVFELTYYKPSLEQIF
ncbi:bacitracin ABC transporter ATP-binding protein, partial [Bacillus megaterium]|nr:bacitracin ABC transporter ATP-binding protein [Priestia megaterium]